MFAPAQNIRSLPLARTTAPTSGCSKRMGERVATVDLRRILSNLVERRDDVSWGPNSTFRFPLHGGTGAIWTAVAARLPHDRMRFGCQVIAIDPDAKQIMLSSGERAPYDVLLSTMPADVM